MIKLKLKNFEDKNIKIEDGYISIKTSNIEELKWSLRFFKNINVIIEDIKELEIIIQAERLNGKTSDKEDAKV